SGGVMGSLTPTRPLPPVIAAVRLDLRDATQLQPSAEAVLLVAEDLQNPDNLGMVLRTAEAAGVEAAVVVGDPLHRNCVRAARGAVGRLAVFTCADLPAWLGDLRRRGGQQGAGLKSTDPPFFCGRVCSPAATKETHACPAARPCCTCACCVGGS